MNLTLVAFGNISIEGTGLGELEGVILGDVEGVEEGGVVGEMAEAVGIGGDNVLERVAAGGRRGGGGRGLDVGLAGKQLLHTLHSVLKGGPALPLCDVVKQLGQIRSGGGWRTRSEDEEDQGEKEAEGLRCHDDCGVGGK